MNPKILQLKHINPVEKLILLHIDGLPKLIPSYTYTSQEIADQLGLKRKEVLDALGSLEERDYVRCEVGYRMRTTRLTERFKTLIT